MFRQEGTEEDNYQQEIENFYKNQQDYVYKKFKNMNIDSLEQIKKKMKRNQNRSSKEENLTLIEHERLKIIADMREHISNCNHPQCRATQSITLLYGITKGYQLQDHVTYIIRNKVEGLGYQKSSCQIANQLNSRMNQTHKLKAGC